MIDVIEDEWGWIGIQPEKIMVENAFGNVIVRAKDGAYWRICPEELECKVIASDEAAMKKLWKEDEFRADWDMDRLVSLAERKLGPVSEERCYCLKIPGVLGGKYEAKNMGTITRREVLAFSGHLAKQIKDLPDGAQVTFKFVD